LTKKQEFCLVSFLEKQEEKTTHKSIFELGRQLQQVDNQIRNIVYDYATDFTKWWKIAECLPELEKASNSYLCNYEQSMEVKDEVSFALSSHYTDNGNYVNISNWVWKRRDSAEKFSFDSESEREWADILKEISYSNAIMPLKVGKIKKEISSDSEIPYSEIEVGTNSNEKEIYLWGKNYVSNSCIKFEYYLGALHSSFPDFVMKDSFGRIHIFEVKSVNQSGAYNFDNNIYKTKVAELEKCYKQASKLTEQIFYLPVIDKDVWHIKCFHKGEQNTLTIDQFRNFVKEE